MNCVWPGPTTCSRGSGRKKGKSLRRPSCWSAWSPSIASIIYPSWKKTRNVWRPCGSASDGKPARHAQGHPRSLPKVEPGRHLRETRRSLVVAACVAALVIMAGVQYLSRRGPDDVVRTIPQKPPTPLAILPPQVPQARSYLRNVRDLAENSLAQVEAMLTAVDRSKRRTGELADTLDQGILRLQVWQRQFAALTPPQTLQNQHREVERLLTELRSMAHAIRSSQTIEPSHPVRRRLTVAHDRLEQVLKTVDDR